MDTVIRGFLLFLAALLLVVLYFLPTLIAWRRGHDKVQALGVLNLLAGWTAIGWIGATVWAFTQAEDEAKNRGFAWLLLIPLAPILAFEFWGASQYRTFDPCEMAREKLATAEMEPSAELEQLAGRKMANRLKRSITGVVLNDANAFQCAQYVLDDD